MPSSKFVFPKNGATIQADTQFTVQMAVKNLQTGNFVNAQTNYFAAPQQLNRQGDIVGHTHVCGSYDFEAGVYISLGCH